MKILQTLLTGTLFLLAVTPGHTQPDSAKISQRAMVFADSLVKTDKYENWSTYADLCPASVIKYYGGKPGFIEHVSMLRKRTFSDLAEDEPVIKLVDLMRQEDQWQCVVQESRYFHKEDKAYHLITYFIGQSKDEGETWRMFDVGYNKVANIIYMFPDIFGDMPIKEPTVVSKDQELADQQKAESSAAAKKAVTKKK